MTATVCVCAHHHMYVWELKGWGGGLFGDFAQNVLLRDFTYCLVILQYGTRLQLVFDAVRISILVFVGTDKY